MQVSRRSFMQSMAAAFAATSLGKLPRFDKPPEINYDLFTDTFSSRYDIVSPWSKDGAIYATDQRILLTHPGEWNATDGDGHFPSVEKLCWDEFDSPGWKELPQQKLELIEDKWGRCHHCMGTGRIGEGIRQNPKYPDDFDGLEMEFIGGSNCGFCSGTGRDEYFHVERIGGTPFCPAYTNRIRTLGGLDCRIAKFNQTEGPEHNRGITSLLLFRGDGGVRGMLMSLKDDEENANG